MPALTLAACCQLPRFHSLSQTARVPAAAAGPARARSDSESSGLLVIDSENAAASHAAAPGPPAGRRTRAAVGRLGSLEPPVIQVGFMITAGTATVTVTVTVGGDRHGD